MDEYHKISFATFMRVVALLEMLGWKVEIEFALNFNVSRLLMMICNRIFALIRIAQSHTEN